MTTSDFYTKCAITPQRWKGCKMSGDGLLFAEAITVTLSTPFVQNMPFSPGPPLVVSFVYPVGSAFSTPQANYLLASTIPIDTVTNQSGTILQFQPATNDVLVTVSGEYVISYNIIFQTYYFDGTSFTTLPLGIAGMPNDLFTTSLTTPNINMSFIGINGGLTTATAKVVDWMTFGSQFTDPNGNTVQDFDVPINSGEVVQYLNAGDTISVKNYAVLVHPSFGTPGQGTTVQCELSVVQVK